MTTDESIMEEMLDRATNPAKQIVDELGVQMFCIVVRSNSQLVHKAQEMIVAKIRSSNVTEATRAIALLEGCMTGCGSEFQDEAAKFRFLNELIRLVSKKYQGAETSHEVKQRILDCLLLWTTEFPKKQKIREAYDMLRKEGGVEHGQSETLLGKRESILDELDEEMFARLIKSNDPENLKRANLLVKYRMNQEARRNELLLQHKCVLQEVQNTIQLLNQMLDSYNPNDKDEHETMHELYKNCKKHKPIFQHLPELLDQSDTQLIADTLDANGMLLSVMQRYKELVASPTTSVNQKTPELPETAGVAEASNSDFFSELLGDLITTTSASANTTAAGVKQSTTLTKTSPVTVTKSGDTLAELNDIFGAVTAESNDNVPQIYPADLLSHTTILESINVAATIDSDDNRLANGVAAKQSKPDAMLNIRKLPEIDVLSDKLFQQILPNQERVTSFKRESDKITLNDLVRERMPPNTSTAASLQQPTKAGIAASVLLPDDDAMLTETPTDETIVHKTIKKASVEETAMASPTPATTPLPTKHLSEINIDLDNVTPTGEERIILDDDDIQLSLNFTEERPSKNVAIIVISAQNKSKQQVKDFQFEASVKKPCKVRLLEPTDSAMPPHKPFRPAAPINQIMLLLNPTGNAVDITCIVGYKLGDDPDPIKESIVAENIPFVA